MLLLLSISSHKCSHMKATGSDLDLYSIGRKRVFAGMEVEGIVFSSTATPPNSTKKLILAGMEVEGIVFSPTVRPPNSTKKLILAGAGVRGMMIEGKFVKFTAIGIYIEEDAVPYIALKWKHKSAEELGNTVDFYMDLVTCPYEKFARVAFVSPLTGVQFAYNFGENCRKAWIAAGIYTEAEAKAIDEYKEAYKDKTFSPGCSALLTVSPAGLVVAFSEDNSIPEKPVAVIENRVLAEEFLGSVIGKNGVSPAAKASIAGRVSKLLNVD